MKKTFVYQAALLCLLAPLTTTIITLPAAAATASVSVGAPQAKGLEVNADNGVFPGSQLRLNFEGSPGGQARVLLPGDITLALKEVAPGRYQGRYTVRRSDRIDPAGVIRVSLRTGHETADANYAFPPSFVALAGATTAPSPALSPAPMTLPTAAAPPRIDHFAVEPVGRAEPGAELVFRLEAVPGARASVDIPGVATNVPLRELRPGHYEGSYVVRRSDNLQAAGAPTATLRTGDNSVATATLRQPLVTDNQPPQIGNLLPRDGESVPPGPTRVAGTFDDIRGAGVDPRSVRIVISGRDVTDQAQITPREFSVRAALPPGRHRVEVVAADPSGNVAQKSWSFDVGSSVVGAAAAMMPLQIVSHTNNAQVGQEVTTVRGRTAPNAVVQVRVDAITPGNERSGRAGVAEQLLVQTVTADAEGDFAFSFNPRYQRDGASTLPVPGTRYEVSISANRDNQSAESKLLLFQRS
jgi:hypothetical protein